MRRGGGGGGGGDSYRNRMYANVPSDIGKVSMHMLTSPRKILLIFVILPHLSLK